jgi:hypothetical protein
MDEEFLQEFIGKSRVVDDAQDKGNYRAGGAERKVSVSGFRA